MFLAIVSHRCSRQEYTLRGSNPRECPELRTLLKKKIGNWRGLFRNRAPQWGLYFSDRGALLAKTLCAEAL